MLFARYHIRIVSTTLLSASMICLPVAAQQNPPDPISSDPLSSVQVGFEQPVKYAIYSLAWNIASNAGLRIMAHNQGDADMEMRGIRFSMDDSDNYTKWDLTLKIPADSWAELQTPYVDLISGNDCVARTLEEDWQLVEISNYTLNPSVRGLIIQDTQSFRIYQCVRNVKVSWYDPARNESYEQEQWLMYHFERLRPGQ